MVRERPGVPEAAVLAQAEARPVRRSLLARERRPQAREVPARRVQARDVRARAVQPPEVQAHSGDPPTA